MTHTATVSAQIWATRCPINPHPTIKFAIAKSLADRFRNMFPCKILVRLAQKSRSLLLDAVS